MLSSAIPVVGELFQWLLDSIGWVLAKIYDFVPNYGVSIIILTLIIRFVLFPLGVKQIKSMQHMQAILTHGAIKGTALATWRVLRCNPYGKGGLDPVPPASHAWTYENVIHKPETLREAPREVPVEVPEEANA